MVADYLIRGFLTLFALVGVASEVRAQSPIRVGYYDMNIGAGAPEQEPPIVAAGFTPVQLSSVSATDLAGLHVLFVQNSSASAYGSEYRENLDAVKNAVNAGLVLIIHDRAINGSPNSNVLSPMMGTRFILPLNSGAAMIAITRANSNTIFATDAATLVANGPHGSITTNLNNGNFSNLGFVNLATMGSVAGRKGLLNNSSSAAVHNSVTFSYPLGEGFVIYSSIPLDMFLKGLGPDAVNDAFKTIYAPNVLTYGACGLKALPAAVSAASASGYYGGSATLTATVTCGGIPVPDATVSFTLNGTTVGSAQTNAVGVATLANASLGSTPSSAIPVGTYAAGVEAAFAGNTLYGASSGTAALTVEKAPATISLAGGEFVYDAAPHAATGTVTGVFGESLGVPSFTYTDEHGVTSEVAPVNAGSYRINASVAENDNYLGTSAESGATIEISPAPLVVTAQDKTKVYGAALPALTATYEGFVAGEDTSVLGGTLHVTTGATAASHVGRYPVTPSGLTSRNYSITFIDGHLTILPAPLKIRADNKERLERLPNPALTATYEGFVLGEDEWTLDSRPQISTAAQQSSPDGEYPIVVKGAQDPDYAIEHIDGTLTVSPEGRMHGIGVVDTADARHRFGFAVSDTIRRGEKGFLTLEVERKRGSDDRFFSLLVSDVVFTDVETIRPGGKAEADAVIIVGIGLWNRKLATFEATATDNGEPGHGTDTVTIRILVGGTLVHETSGALKSGNIQSNRLPRRR